MKGKTLNILMYILVLAIVIVGSFVVYITFFVEKHAISFQLNGADKISQNYIECTKSLKGCYVILPNIERSNAVILGFSKDKESEKEEYKIGEKLYIKEDMTLYAVSYIIRNVHIEKNGVDELAGDRLSCNAYNENTSCKVTLPIFNKVGYQIAGYQTDKNGSSKTPGEYFPNEEYLISSDLTLYPKYTSDRRGNNYIYNTNKVYEINGSIVEAEKTISKTDSDLYISFLEEIKEKAPFLLVGSKISIMTNASFTKTWAKGIIGICYGSSIEGHPLSRSIDVLSKYYPDDYENYFTLVHEMTHAWDFYYPYKLNGKIPEVSDLGRSFYGTMSEYNRIFGTERISAQQDIVDLFNKYKRLPSNQRPFGDYAYTATTEFVAEAMAHYYMKYYVPKGKYINLDYPADIKNVLEKYICVAKNNYNKNAC